MDLRKPRSTSEEDDNQSYDTEVMSGSLAPVSAQVQCKYALPKGTVTCELKLFQNYFGLHRRPSEIILFQRVETCLKSFQNYLRGLLQLTNTFMFNVAEIVLK